MKIVNFGSLNLDHVYRVKHFVRPGETLTAESLQRFRGGKGANQSIALARAGVKKLCHAGCIGKDGIQMKETLEKEGVDCRFLFVSEHIPTGHAVIQVTDSGENNIILFGGANRAITVEMVDQVVDFLEEGDYLVLQNEINLMDRIMTLAHRKGARIFLNPAPMNGEILSCPLELADTFIINETEACGLAGENTPGDSFSPPPPEYLLEKIRNHFPSVSILLTLGEAGALYSGKDSASSGKILRIPAVKTRAVDTTAAGDTFTGYFIAGLFQGMPLRDSLSRAARASAAAVSRKGAQSSIPRLAELKEADTTSFSPENTHHA